jgi:hypothetical protein
LPNPELQTPVHDCKEFLSEVTQVRVDLKDTPLSGCKLNWYTDESSFVQNGVRRAGAAVVDQEGNTVWSSALPPEISAQKAELIALAGPWKGQKENESISTPIAAMLSVPSTSTEPFITKGDFAQQKGKA